MPEVTDAPKKTKRGSAAAQDAPDQSEQDQETEESTTRQDDGYPESSKYYCHHCHRIEELFTVPIEKSRQGVICHHCSKHMSPYEASKTDPALRK